MCSKKDSLYSTIPTEAPEHFPAMPVCVSRGQSTLEGTQEFQGLRIPWQVCFLPGGGGSRCQAALPAQAECLPAGSLAPESVASSCLAASTWQETKVPGPHFPSGHKPRRTAREWQSVEESPEPTSLAAVCCQDLLRAALCDRPSLTPGGGWVLWREGTLPWQSQVPSWGCVLG